MTDNAFDLIDQALRSGGPDAGFHLLAHKVLEEKNYPLLFEVRLLKKRHELGLPLIQVDDSAAMPADTRREYDKAFIDAAREVGGLDRKSTRLNSSHANISYAVFCLKKKKKKKVKKRMCI